MHNKQSDVVNRPTPAVLDQLDQMARDAEIRKLWREALPVAYIARCFGITEQQVRAICVGDVVA